MKAYVVLETNNGTITVPITSLEGVVSVLGEHGFYDVDVDPGIGSVHITATSKSASVSVTGATLNDACEKLIERLL